MAKIDCWSCSKNSMSGDLEDEVERLLLVDCEFEIEASPLLERRLDQKQQQRRRQAGVLDRWKHTLQSFKNAMVPSTRSSSGAQRRKRAWNAAVETLMHQHPGSQLPERLISMIQRHFDSLPSSYAQAGFSCEETFLHIRLIEQARSRTSVGCDEQSAVHLESGRSSNATESSSMGSPSLWEDEQEQQMIIVTFASIDMPMSKQAICWAFKRSGIQLKRVQIFERKRVALGTAVLHIDQIDPPENGRMQAILLAAAKRSRLLRLTLGFYHHHEHHGNDHVYDGHHQQRLSNVSFTTTDVIVEDNVTST